MYIHSSGDTVLNTRKRSKYFLNTRSSVTSWEALHQNHTVRILVLTESNARVYFLTEGSGMFGLKNPEDAMRWKGIFNHVMGTARQVCWLAQRFKGLTPEERSRFEQLGFDFSDFDRITPELLRDFMLISHAGRRASDEYRWHGLRDSVHQTDESGISTIGILQRESAPWVFQELMRVENHAEHLAAVKGDDQFPNIVDNILTYCDWTFGQQPNTLFERFEGLRARSRTDSKVLNTLQQAGTRFENALNEIMRSTLRQEMANSGPYEWEIEIREAYCAPSGIDPRVVFPDIFPQGKDANATAITSSLSGYDSV